MAKTVENKGKSGTKARQVNKYVLLKRQVVKLLTDKGVVEKTDTTLIDELIFNYKLIDKVKQELLSGEYMTQVRRDESYPLMQVSAQTSVYNNCLKNILAISRQLGITPSERSKLKLLNKTDENDDGF